MKSKQLPLFLRWTRPGFSLRAISSQNSAKRFPALRKKEKQLDEGSVPEAQKEG